MPSIKSPSSNPDPPKAEPPTEPDWSHRYPSDYESISSFEEVPPWQPKPSKWAEVNQVDAIFARLILATKTKSEEAKAKEAKQKEKEYEGNLRFRGMTTEEIIDSLMDSRESLPRSFENPHEDLCELREEDFSDSESEVETSDGALEKEGDDSQWVTPRLAGQENSTDKSLAV